MGSEAKVVILAIIAAILFFANYDAVRDYREERQRRRERGRR